MVTFVPPALGPRLGLTDETHGTVPPEVTVRFALADTLPGSGVAFGSVTVTVEAPLALHGTLKPPASAGWTRVVPLYVAAATLPVVAAGLPPTVTVTPVLERALPHQNVLWPPTSPRLTVWPGEAVD